MGAKLTFLSFWMPNYVLRRELDNLSNVTNQALKELLHVHAPNAQVIAASTESFRSLDGKRAMMTKQHTILVDALVKALGQELR